MATLAELQARTYALDEMVQTLNRLHREAHGETVTFWYSSNDGGWKYSRND
ncbi:hypothetical protein SEA_BAZZLE_139 [Mycobacterium phage Bazzle]